MKKANERQVGGSHYKANYQHWDFAADTPLNYFEANATKYITRWRDKDGLEDVQKAEHYLQKLYELYQQRRLELPLMARRTNPLLKFLEHRKHDVDDFNSKLEVKIFFAIVNYTTLEQLLEIRADLHLLVESISNPKKKKVAAAK